MSLGSPDTEALLVMARLTIRTDQDALRWILNMAYATGKLARWKLRLYLFEFDVVHLDGIKHQAEDAL